jgi:catechol 2,3-dioxygenase-like lactoylglutathione lyase family enzyme
VKLDHLILAVNDVDASVAFYARILGLADAGERPPFRVLRVTDDFVIQLAPWGTPGGEHLAFALPRAEFDACFARLREAGVPFGDSPHDAANGHAPGDEAGARGACKSIYFFDPSRHLIEIATYE